MKRILIVFFAVICFNAVYAEEFDDPFVDVIQDLAVQTACLGIYSSTQAGGGWYDDPHDYYTVQMVAERLAKMSGNMTRSEMFYGVCFDYAQFAWIDIKKYKSFYNDCGMYEGQFWLANVYDDSNLIILAEPTTQEKATIIQNGVPIKTFGDRGNRNVKAHKTASGKSAKRHTWIWIERADGVWFWVDPTWTDNLGYVVYGYVKNGEEIQCRPNPAYCIVYPDYLKTLPLPPSMGKRIAPSKTANSTNRSETINDAMSDRISDVINEVFVRDYRNMDQYIGLLLNVSMPFYSLIEKDIEANKMGYGIGLLVYSYDLAGESGLEYVINREDDNNLHGLFLESSLMIRLTNNITWYPEVGIGLRFDFSNSGWLPKDQPMLLNSGYFAWELETGFVLNLANVFAKLAISYNNVTGLSAAAGIGFALEAY